MQPQFDHSLVASFYLWLENSMLENDFSAYVTGVPNSFVKINHPDTPDGYVMYQGAYRQLVADSGISQPISGFYVNGNFLSANSGVSNMVIDYNNGAIFFPTASGNSLEITGYCAVKEVNTYLINQDEEDLLLHSDFIDSTDTTPYLFNNTGKLDRPTFFIPACFVSMENSDNKEFAFGGQEDTRSRIKITIIAKDSFVVDGCLAKFRDSAREVIRVIDFNDYPYGYLDSLKSYPYSYQALVDAQTCVPENTAYVQSVNTYKLKTDSIKQKLQKDFVVGFADFDLSTHRFPRL